MTTYRSRSSWTSVPAGGSRMPSNPRGVAVHWPGSTHPLGNPAWTAVANRLEGYRRFHAEGRGWADIAYQVAFSQRGDVVDLRGIGRRSAANGNSELNREWGAVLFLVGPGEHPSPAMIRAFSDWYRDRWLKAYPGAERVVGHRDIRPDGTACPGPATYQLITTGDILRPEEEDMPSAEEIVDELLRRKAWTNPQTGKDIDFEETLAIAANYAYDGWALGLSERGTRALVAAQSTALKALAESKGGNAKEIADLLERTMRDWLAQYEVSVIEKDGGS